MLDAVFMELVVAHEHSYRNIVITVEANAAAVFFDAIVDTLLDSVHDLSVREEAHPIVILPANLLQRLNYYVVIFGVVNVVLDTHEEQMVLAVLVCVLVRFVHRFVFA